MEEGKMEENKPARCQWWKEIPNICRGIVTIDLTFKAPNVLEKLIFISMGILGMLWITYFVMHLATDANPITETMYFILFPPYHKTFNKRPLSE